jgi:hypothetical protein
VKHPHEFFPKLLEPRGLVVVEFPFPFERGGGGIVFPVFLRRFALVVGGGFFGSFLATGQQAVDEGLAVLDQEPQLVAFLVVGTQGAEQV